jgi:predicted ATP-dependent protease
VKASFAVKQKILEDQFQTALETAKKERQRKKLESAERKDKEFERRYQTLISERNGFVADMANTIHEIDLRAQRKKETLYEEWMNHVYSPLQQQINTAVELRDPTETAVRHLEAMDAFLSATKRKGGQLFGDIIAEAEYDPLQHRTENHLKVKSVVKYDPCKPKSLTKVNQESEWAVKSLPCVYPKAKAKEMLPVTMWNKVEATPYGRYAIDTTPRGRKHPRDSLLANRPTSMGNDYDVPTGERAQRLRNAEQGDPGKKILGPPVEAHELRLGGKKTIQVMPNTDHITPHGKRCQASLKEVKGDSPPRGGKKILPPLSGAVDLPSPSGKRVFSKSVGG